MAQYDSRFTIQQSPENTISYTMGLVTDKYPGTKFSFDHRPMFQQSQESNPSHTMGLGTNKYPGTKFSFDHRPMFQQSLDSNPSYTMGLMIKQYPDRNIPSFFFKQNKISNTTANREEAILLYEPND